MYRDPTERHSDYPAIEPFLVLMGSPGISMELVHCVTGQCEKLVDSITQAIQGSDWG